MNLTIIDRNFNGQTVQTTNSRDLHEFLGVKSAFNDWINRRIKDYEFQEGLDFTIIATQEKVAMRGGHNRKDYYISLDMAKELSMVERTEKGKEARQYFIQCERLAKRVATQPTLVDLDDPEMLRGLLSNYAERTQIAETRVTELEPKAEAMERLEASEGSVTPRIAAKVLDIGERKFIKWMEVNSWAFRQGKILQGYAERRKQGYLEHEPRTFIDGRGEERTSVQLKITPKGMGRLAQIFSNGGLA